MTRSACLVGSGIAAIERGVADMRATASDRPALQLLRPDRTTIFQLRPAPGWLTLDA